MQTLSGHVLRSQSGQYWVETPEGIVHCRLRGRLKQGRRAHTDLVVIGDRVTLQRLPDEADEGIIEEVAPRENRFARRQPGGRGNYKEHVLVANLDWLVAVFACGRPPMNPRVLDRFLVVAELDGIAAAIVANKVDQVGPEEAERLFAPYAALGYPVIYTSALDGTGVDALRALTADKTSAFVGPSGVGKSSLLNALEPSLGLATGEVSETLDKGRHTTRVAQLHPLSHGGYLADTPGIRELASFALPARELAGCFPEMRPFLGACRFVDCLHAKEPGCAVREAVERGEIARDRYDSYQRILQDDQR